MAEQDFYNQNLRRLYPFIPTLDSVQHLSAGIDLPQEAILDAGFTLGPLARFETDSHDVRLRYVKRVGSNLEIVFEATSASMSDKPFVFIRSADEDFGATDFVEATHPDFGTAFLVTGKLEALHASLPDGVEILPFVTKEGEDSVIEPALIVSQNNQRVQSLNVGNLPKPAAVNCCDVLPVLDLNTVVVETEDLVGDIVFREGVNVNISITPGQPIITFRPEIGAGAGVPCEDINEVETTQPKCSDLIYTMNGIKPSPTGAFLITGGTGFLVDTQPANNKIVIKGTIETSVACEDD